MDTCWAQNAPQESANEPITTIARELGVAAKTWHDWRAAARPQPREPLREDHDPVGTMGEVLGVSRSGFYAWRGRPLIPRPIADGWLYLAVVLDRYARRVDPHGGWAGHRRLHRPVLQSRALAFAAGVPVTCLL